MKECSNTGRTLFEAVINKIIWGGYGLAEFTDGRKILVRAPVALFPGDVVQVELELKRNFATGVFIDWVSKSANHCQPDCEYAYQCGGCSFWGAGKHYDSLKQTMVNDIIAAQKLYKNINWQWIPAKSDDKRFRIQLHYSNGELGFYKWKSNQVVPINFCLMAQPIISDATIQLRQAIDKRLLPHNVERWELICDFPASSVWAVGLQNTGSVWRLDDDKWQAFNGRIVYGLNSRSFSLSPGTFFQSIPTLAEEAFCLAFDKWQLTGSVLFDLYGGCGFVSGLLAKKFNRYIVIENSKSAIDDCSLNLSDLELKTNCKSVELWFEKPIMNPDAVVVLDPPRAGLHPKVTAQLNQSDVKNLVLIGCDGACFWRDVNKLSESWQLIDLFVADLFPNTPHCEFIGLLVKDR